MKKSILTVILLLVFVLISYSQIINPVKWSFDQKQISNTEYELIFDASIEKGWHLYSDKLPEGGPIATSIVFENTEGFELIGKISTKPEAEKVFDTTFNMELEYFSNKARFTQKIKLTSSSVTNVKGYVEYMSCNDETCTPPTEADFSFEIEESQSSEIKNSSEERTGTKDSLWKVILSAILWGFGALLTPCVFPMIPMTVSFFIKGNNKPKAVQKFNASFYGISIVALYTIPIAVIIFITYLFGGKTVAADMFNFLGTHWIPNLIFFLVFLVFAASFFGAFELVLPSRFVNKIDSKSDKGGLVGVFFMALTLVLVSFSCTGPIVGTLIVDSTSGEIWTPIITMLAFSIAFALPFTLFAFFPSLMDKLPKSGGWLNSVKVVIGFIELGLGLKFLSLADINGKWGILDREVFLVLWIVIFAMLGLYLIGKLKFAHDSELKFISVPRLFMSIGVFAFVIYLIPGLWGAPLKGLSGYLPEMKTQDFNINKIVREEFKRNKIISNENVISFPDSKLEIYNHLELPLGLNGFFDYFEALEYAKKVNKPLFIDFTGHSCANCREMEVRVWSNEKVLERLRNDFVIVALYVDDRQKLPEDSWVVSDFDGKVKKTIGKVNADFQISRFGVNAQPYYVILDHNEEMLVQPKARDLNPNNFVKFLDEALDNFKK